MSPVMVVGDVIDDVLAVTEGPIRPDTDTLANIAVRPGGSAANTACWIGYGTDMFPSFWLPKSEFPLDWSADTPAEVAALMAATWEMGLRSGILVANPVPEDKAWNREDHDRIIQMAFDAAERDGIRGKEVTPYLLDFIQRESSGESLRVNLDVVRNNIRVACDIATAWAGH